MKRILWVALLCALPCPAQTARQNTPCKPGLQLVNGDLVAVNCKGQETQIAAAPAATTDQPAQLSPSEKAAADAELNYRAYSWHHAQQVFEWQYRSTIMIFFVSTLLVLAGIVFAAWQLQYSMRLGRHRMKIMAAQATALTAAANQGASSSAPDDSNDTTLKVSATGLEVHSATLGVIILAFSMCFFYMYLKYVYPIQLIPTHPPAQSNATGPQNSSQ